MLVKYNDRGMYEDCVFCEHREAHEYDSIMWSPWPRSSQKHQIHCSDTVRGQDVDAKEEPLHECSMAWELDDCAYCPHSEPHKHSWACDNISRGPNERVCGVDMLADNNITCNPLGEEKKEKAKLSLICDSAGVIDSCKACPHGKPHNSVGNCREVACCGYGDEDAGKVRCIEIEEDIPATKKEEKVLCDMFGSLSECEKCPHNQMHLASNKCDKTNTCHFSEFLPVRCTRIKKDKREPEAITFSQELQDQYYNTPPLKVVNESQKQYLVIGIGGLPKSQIFNETTSLCCSGDRHHEQLLLSVGDLYQFCPQCGSPVTREPTNVIKSVFKNNHIIKLNKCGDEEQFYFVGHLLILNLAGNFSYCDWDHIVDTYSNPLCYQFYFVEELKKTFPAYTEPEKVIGVVRGEIIQHPTKGS